MMLLGECWTQRDPRLWSKPRTSFVCCTPESSVQPFQTGCDPKARQEVRISEFWLMWTVDTGKNLQPAPRYTDSRWRLAIHWAKSSQSIISWFYLTTVLTALFGNTLLLPAFICSSQQGLEAGHCRRGLRLSVGVRLCTSTCFSLVLTLASLFPE